MRFTVLPLHHHLAHRCRNSSLHGSPLPSWFFPPLAPPPRMSSPRAPLPRSFCHGCSSPSWFQTRPALPGIPARVSPLRHSLTAQHDHGTFTAARYHAHRMCQHGAHNWAADCVRNCGLHWKYHPCFSHFFSSLLLYFSSFVFEL